MNEKPETPQEGLIDELLDKIKKQSMEIARLNAINASYSLDRRELAEHLAESGREHFKLGNFQLAMKIKTVVKRVAG